MKKILFFLTVLISFNSFAQPTPTGQPSGTFPFSKPQNNRGNQVNGIQVQTELYIAYRDTDFVAARPGALVKRPADSANSTIYASYKGGWVAISSGVTSQNFANTDLSFTGNRYHNAKGYFHTLDSLGWYKLKSYGASSHNLMDFTGDIGGRNGGIIFWADKSDHSKTSILDIDWEGIDITGKHNRILSEDSTTFYNPAIAYKNDSIHYKPLTIDIRSGKLTKSYWGNIPGTTTPTLQQVGTAGDTYTGTITADVFASISDITSGGNVEATNNVVAGGDILAAQYKLSNLNTAPASASDTGTLGEIRITASYIYVCIATNTWVRSALTTW